MTDELRRDLIQAERIIDAVLDDDLTDDEFNRLNRLFHDLDDMIGDTD